MPKKLPTETNLSDLPAGVQKAGTEYIRHSASLWRLLKREQRLKGYDDEILVMLISQAAWVTGFKSALRAMLRQFPATDLEKCRGKYPAPLDEAADRKGEECQRN